MSTKQVAAIAGIVAAMGAGFFVLGNARSAGRAQPGAALTAAPASGAAGQGAPKGPPPVPVLVAVAVQREMRQVLEVTGTLRTDEDVQIGARLPGKVVRVTAKEGDRVTRGQVLVQLDDRELKAQIARARGVLTSAQAKLSLAGNQSTWKNATAKSEHQGALANLKAAKARVQQAETAVKLVETETKLRVETANSGVRVATERLSIARDLTRKQDLRQAQLGVERAMSAMGQTRVDMENARQMFERRQKLLAQDAIAREEVDEAERRYKSAQAAVRVAESNVDVARQRLDLAREGSRAEEVRMAEETLYSAQQTLEQAKSDQGKRDVAQNDLEAARVAERRAESAVQAAKAGLVQTRMSQDEVASARAAISQARADIEVYQSQLADLVIRAPVSGVVTTRRVNVGETVTSNSVLMNVVAMDVVYFEARVPELEVSLLRPGASARVFVDSKPGRQFTGIVREVIPVADRDSRAFRVRVAVQGGGGELPPGGYARAIVPVGTHGNAVAIAKEAVHTEAGVKFVWLVADSPKGGQVAKRQPVKVGLTDAKYAEVLGGLAPGQRVITSGSPAIIEGTPISVVTR